MAQNPILIIKAQAPIFPAHPSALKLGPSQPETSTLEQFVSESFFGFGLRVSLPYRDAEDVLCIPCAGGEVEMGSKAFSEVWDPKP